MTDNDVMFPDTQKMLSELQAIAERAATEEDGEIVDFVYESPLPPENGAERGDCLYVHETEQGRSPGCIFGHWLRERGVSFEQLKEWERWRISMFIENVVPTDMVTLYVASTVQRAQDRGEGWLSAVAEGWAHMADYERSESGA